MHSVAPCGCAAHSLRACVCLCGVFGVCVRCELCSRYIGEGGGAAAIAAHYKATLDFVLSLQRDAVADVASTVEAVSVAAAGVNRARRLPQPLHSADTTAEMGGRPFSHVIILEDDLLLSPHFAEYFAHFLHDDQGKDAFCISAWCVASSLSLSLSAHSLFTHLTVAHFSLSFCAHRCTLRRSLVYSFSLRRNDNGLVPFTPPVPVASGGSLFGTRRL